MQKLCNESLIDALPKVRGKYRPNSDLSKLNWFQVGGAAEILFKPEDAEDLLDFLNHCPTEIPITILGVGSNVIIRDGGIKGVVIRLGRGFIGMEVIEQQSHTSTIKLGAGCLNSTVTEYCIQNGFTGLEFLSGIPGSIGGALKMNGGAYGSETKDVLISAEIALRGCKNITRIDAENLHYTYRHCGLDEKAIFTAGYFRVRNDNPEAIASRVAEIQRKREDTQPIRSRTGGSTFKNPDGHKAWELIDRSGLRGFKLGGAQVSEKHCNFLINTGSATASDLEDLGEYIRKTVLDSSGVLLEWEIKRIGTLPST
jgi:UDP-N-acetylmuramate dehydrogenase